MNYGNGYNQPYVQPAGVNYGRPQGYYNQPQPYYNQPMIVQPQPQVIIVEERYNQNNLAAAEAAVCACCLLELLCCCLLWYLSQLFIISSRKHPQKELCIVMVNNPVRIITQRIILFHLLCKIQSIMIMVYLKLKRWYQSLRTSSLEVIGTNPSKFISTGWISAQ